MAEVPISPGPQVAPSVGGAPQVTTRPLPEAFGPSVAGEALGEAGKAATATSDALLDYAAKFQAINNKQAADAASYNTGVAQNQAFLDYQDKHKGMAAADPANLSALFTTLDDIRNKGMAGLSPVAQVDYQGNSRITQTRLLVSARTYAYEQRKDSILKTADATIQTQQANAAAAAYGTPQFDAATKAIAEQVFVQSTQLGLSNEQAHALLQDKVGGVFLSQIDQAYAAGDLAGANKIFADHKGSMTLDQIDRASNMLRVANTANNVATEAHAAIFGGGGAAGGGGPDNRTLAQIEHDESGGRNVVNYKEARGEKGFTASGYYQITDPTWREFAPPDVAAKYPRAIDAPRDVQTQVAQTIQSQTGNTRWAESARGGASAGAVLPTTTTNLDQWSADAMARANTYAQQHYANDVNMRDRILAEADKQIKLTIGPLAAQQKATFDTTLSAITGGPIQSQQDLDTRFPALSSQVSPQQYRQLIGYAEQEGRIPTPAQQQAEVGIVGQLEAARAGRLDPRTIDINGAGLSPQQAMPLLKLQAQLENKPAPPDKGIEAIIKMPEVQSAMQSVRWVDAQGKPRSLPETVNGSHFDNYWQFYGLLTEEVHAYQAQNNGKMPDRNTILKIVNESFAKVTLQPAQGPDLFHWFGQPAVSGYQFQVPAPAEARIRQWFASPAGGNVANPSQEQIGEQYGRFLRAQGTLK